MAGKGYKIAIGTLTGKYARLKGELSVIEKLAEDASGVEEIDEAIALIDRRKAEIDEALVNIEAVIWLFDEGWDPASVRPIRLRRQKFPPGTISKAAYDILRLADHPLTTREIAREVAVALGIKELVEANIVPIDIALATNLPRRLDALDMEPGPPRRWSAKRFEEPAAVDAASTRATRSTQAA